MKNFKLNIKLAALILCSSFILSGKEAEASNFVNIKLTQTCGNTKINNMLNEYMNQKEEKTDGIVISLLGDCTVGMDEDSTYKNNFNSILEQYGLDYFISGKVRDILTSDDITLANLETALTTSDNIQEKQFNFKGDPENINILINGGVDIVNISNNHTNDYGKEGYEDTIDTLNDYDMPFAGDEYVTVKEVKGKRIGFFGLKKANLTKDAIDERIKSLNDLGVDLIIASVHWGEEGEYDFNSEQEDLGHYMIDNGVDIVSGNHPHCLQGIEEYNGGIIAYSNGNFCFGGNKNPKDKDTMILQITINLDSAVKEYKLDIIPCKISSTDLYNDFRPTLATGEEAERIENKILKLSKNIEPILK